MNEDTDNLKGTTFWVGFVALSIGLGMRFGTDVGLIFFGAIATALGMFIILAGDDDDSRA